MTTGQNTLGPHPTTHRPRLDLDELAPDIGRAMNRLDAAAVRGLDPVLMDLVRTHASQLNGCAYCVDMHTKDALAGGETDQRLFALPVWRETGYFDERERSALALTEVVTRLSDAGVPDDVYDEAARHFEPAELAQLIGVLVAINAWNRIGVTTRAWEPGSYQP